MNQVMNKKISVLSLNTQNISPKPGQTFRAFTIYTIGGNDGITYETNDAEWYGRRKIGELIDISYYVESKPGRNGQVFSHYKIVVPKAPAGGANGDLLMKGLTKIYARIEEMEKNIISAIEMNRTKLPEVQINQEEEVDFDQVNAELQAGGKAEIPAEDEVEQEEGELPF